jgi:hypothetical protein
MLFEAWCATAHQAPPANKLVLLPDAPEGLRATPVMVEVRWLLDCLYLARVLTGCSDSSL